MKYAIILLPQIPLRTSVRHESEMGSQLLFGDRVEIMETFCEWSKVRNLFDDYQGWVNTRQLHPLTETQNERFKQFTPSYFTQALTPLKYQSKTLWISIGCRTIDPLILDDSEWIMPHEEAVTEWKSLALRYLGAPYLWGGAAISGIDCSGFVQRVAMMCGQTLPRDASEQAQVGQLVNFIHEAQAGDLLFFDNEEGKITHVGLYLGDQQIIHASGEVRIDAIDHQGIFMQEQGVYTHNLRLIRRLPLV